MSDKKKEVIVICLIALIFILSIGIGLFLYFKDRGDEAGRERVEASSEVTTEATTEVTTEVTTEATTKATTEETTEATTEATTEDTTEETTEDTTEETTEATTEAVTEAEEPVDIVVADDSTNMKVGDICVSKELYVGLSYAKTSDYFTNVLNERGYVGEENQVLFAFFDVYNSSDRLKKLDKEEFNCYVDGVACTKAESLYYIAEDGVTERVAKNIYDNTCKMILANYVIPKGWSEIKLCYGSNCWVLTADDVSTEPFEKESMYDVDYVKPETSVGDVVYSDDYEIVFDGFDYGGKNYTGEKVILFKYTINNTSNSELDYCWIGFNMNLYADNYATDFADYTFDESVDGYVNVYDVSFIEPGESSKVYVSFIIDEEHDFYRMVYDNDDGDYDYLADVYVSD